ncbi:MAG: class III lanthionine synthetase LanKC [Acidobacteria bacterium]|nr:class III lanthionine synthetase LanKC [Acidobacteriota bacterium]
MFSDKPFFAYTFSHPDYYESLDHYSPDPDFRQLVEEFLPLGWEISARGFWTHSAPQDYRFLQQGWKIHVSAAPSSARQTIKRTIPLLVERGIAFKFVSDEVMLRISLSKGWSRSGAGKFMTIYPRSDDEFIAVIEELHARTSDLVGPYILSDRPYKDSRTIFYRYGEHISRRRVERTGFLTPLIEGPDGNWQPDERQGYFHLPSWVRDPLSERSPLSPPGEGGVLLRGRYQVKSSIRFGAVGGIYRAVDTQTAREVVVREARPLLGVVQDDVGGFLLLQKEARILQRLAATGLLPQFVDLFQEWEHLFLVQERIVAESLWGHALNFYFARPEQSPAECLRMFRDTALKLVAALRQVHTHGVVLRDLTRNNTLVMPDGAIRFIDLEFAYEIGEGDSVLWVQTPGYASPGQLVSLTPTFQDDHYSLGALLLDILTFNASGLDLNRDGILAALDLTLRDLRLPGELSTLIRGLIERDPELRWDLDHCEEFLRSLPEPRDDQPLFHHFGQVPDTLRPESDLRPQVRDTIEGLANFIHAKTRLSREDALWPSSAEVYFTNPVNLQYGAAGTAFFLLRAEGKVPAEVLDWIARQAVSHLCPPGLARGLAGVALLLLESGRPEQALRLLELGAKSPILQQDKSLYFGAAGWGLAQLHFWHRLGEARFLEEAFNFGRELARSAHVTPEGVTWAAPERSPHGLVEGPSGIGLFLLHLAATTDKPEFLDLALEALRFDLAHRQTLGAHLLWYPVTNAPPSEPKSPHLWFGTAGIGAVLLRAYALTGDSELRAWAERCAASVAERYTNKIWHDFGLAGFGELLLDCYAYLGDEKYLNSAFYIAEALLQHRIPRDEGFAYVGQEHHRICCDFGWGAAGIGMFFDRLLDPSKPRLLMVDSLIKARAAERSLTIAGQVLVGAR